MTGEKEEEKTHNEGVSEVEERAGESLNLEFGGVEMDAVDEEIDGCEAGRHERSPPPVIVLHNANTPYLQQQQQQQQQE